jgi:demethylmenaquinone methyltransferase/2-methoxy-6-polyprenyl-1,4-benzoquinol methylase
MDNLNSIIQQQIAYYQARASEYDEWFLRQGRYDRGEELNRQWFQEVEQVRLSLNQFKPAGKVLELACGTGLWTEQLLLYAQDITAVDAVAEVLKLNEQRLNSSRIKYLQTDIFTLQLDQQYDEIFFSFWLSHVPAEYFEQFWKIVARALKPDGRVFFVDSRYDPTSTARDHHLTDIQDEIALRRLNDGREFRIVKIFYEQEQLQERLNQLGWKIKVNGTPHYFIFGEGGAA